MTKPLVVLLVVLGAAPLAAQELPAWLELEPGPHPVGFEVRAERDPERRFGGAPAARPLQVALWFPARPQPEPEHLEYLDYVVLGQHEIDLAAPDAASRERAAEAFMAQPLSKGGSRELLEAALAQGALAGRSSRPADGPFPLVLYAPSFDAGGYENSVLCEYLASHGFVVAALPSTGAASAEMTLDAAGLEAQATDLAWLLEYASALPFVDADRVAAVGFSWGGAASMLAAARDRRLDAVVSLDGSLQALSGPPGEAAWLGPADLVVPVLHMTSWGDAQELRPLSRKLYGPTELVKFRVIGHRNFSADAIVRRDRSGVPETIRFYEKKGAKIERGYRAALLLTHAFLDAHLRSRSERLRALRAPEESLGLEPGDLTVARKAGMVGRPPSPEEFLELLESAGFDAAVTRYYELELLAPETRLIEREPIRALAYEALEQGRLDEAETLFWLIVREYPGDPESYFHLGEYYRSKGFKAQARRYYERTLLAAPGHERATAALARLGG